MAKKILLADDSMTIQKVVELTFMDQDFEVEAVSDGASAIARIGETQPDIIVADVHMPGADGYEVCAKWKASSPAIPVLLLVGTFEQFDEQRATQSGANDHLKKPFDSQELLQKVQVLVSGGGAAAPAAAVPPELSTRPTPAPQPPAVPAAPEPADTAGQPVTPEPATPEPDAAVFATQAARFPESPAVSEPAAPQPAAPQPAAPEPVAPPPVETVAVPGGQPADSEPAAPEPAAPEPAAPEPAAPEPAAPEPATPAAEMRPSTAETRPRRAEPVASEPGTSNGSLSDEDVERIARKVVELAGATAVKEVAWEILPDLAEVVIRERIQELESGVD